MAIPRGALSKAFEDCLGGRRLHSAVFTTFQFDPGFFEQEILPVFLNVQLSHVPLVRIVQLEEALREVPGDISVYYDIDQLVTGDGLSAKLDVRRIPVRHKAGYCFHPKNVFLLVENDQKEEGGTSMIAATLSANLTRSGWWENVEVCHIEEITHGGLSSIAKEMTRHLGRIRRMGNAGAHAGIDEMMGFLRASRQRKQRTEGGRLFPHFYEGGKGATYASVTDMIDSVAGEMVRGANLEVISPYFDDAESSVPLEGLIARFKPQETRVLLPRERSGVVGCSKAMYESIGGPNGNHSARWSTLPRDLLKLGPAESAGERFVHAKIYRFFTQRPKREIIFCGSVNLTKAAHNAGGNIESGFLVETSPEGRLDFWLTPLDKEPEVFEVASEDPDLATSRGSRLALRYHWDSGVTEAYWDMKIASGTLELRARGQQVAILAPIDPLGWIVLDEPVSKAIEAALSETSLFEVAGEGEEDRLLLVQEEGMHSKPSILLQLSPSDILRYWSMLTLAQRAAFIESRAMDGMAGLDDLWGTRRASALGTGNGLFDQVAGIFHAFGSLERSVVSALESDKVKDATYRIFGQKYDSLGSLLEKLDDDASPDPLTDYLILLCAKQLCSKVENTYPTYWLAHMELADGLQKRLERVERLRSRLIAANDETFPEFLDWFDDQFLRRAVPKELL